MINEVTQESLPFNRDPLHMYCIVLGMYTHMLCLVPAKMQLKLARQTWSVIDAESSHMHFFVTGTHILHTQRHSD